MCLKYLKIDSNEQIFSIFYSSEDVQNGGVCPTKLKLKQQHRQQQQRRQARLRVLFGRAGRLHPNESGICLGIT